MYVYFDMSVQFHTVSVSSSLIIDPASYILYSASYTIDFAPCTMYHARWTCGSYMRTVCAF